MRKALYFLGSLDDADIEWISHRSRKIPFAQGDALIRRGEAIEHLYILLEGQLSVCIGDDARQEIATLLPGEIIGEISFVDNRKPTATVYAVKESRLLALHRAELSAKLARDLGFASRFYRAIALFLADRLFTTTARLGYGTHEQDDHNEPDLIEDSLMDEVSLASIRFGKLLRYLANDQNMASFAAVRS